MRILIPLLIVLALPAAAAVAEPSPKSILDDLRSDDARVVAWAAWRAAETDLREAAPLIKKQLAKAVRSERGPTALSNLVDAAARLEVMPSLETMVRLADDWPTGAALLCSKNGQAAQKTTLAAFDALPPGWAGWIAVGNALNRWRANGVMHRAFRHLEVRRLVRVTDGNELGSYRPPGGSVPGCGVVRRDPKWPPTVIYEISLDNEGELLSAGTFPIYVKRTVVESEQGFSSVGRSDPSVNDCCVAWLGLRIETTATVDIRYVGRQPWQRALNKIAAAYYTTVFVHARVLLREGRLTESEAKEITPKIHFEVRDMRRDQRHALPDLQIEPPRNPWTRPARMRASY